MKYYKFLLWMISFTPMAQALGQVTVDKNRLSDWIQNQQYTDAIDYLQQLYKTDAHNVQLLTNLGYVNELNDNRKAGREYFERTLELDSMNIIANRYLAMYNLNDKMYEQSLVNYNRLLHIFPDNAMLLKQAGDVFAKMKQKDSALKYYQSAYQLATNNPKIVYAFADKLIASQQYVKADSILHQYLSIDTANLPILTAAIESAYLQEQYKEVIRLSKYYITLSPPVASTAHEIAAAYYLDKQYKECAGLCESFINQGLETETLYYYTAKAYTKLGNYQLSNSFLDKCLGAAVSPRAETYYLSKAVNEEALNKASAAIACHDTAFYMFKNPVVLYDAGRIYESKLKNTHKAKIIYKQCYELMKRRHVPKDEMAIYEFVKSKTLLKKENDRND